MADSLIVSRDFTKLETGARISRKALMEIRYPNSINVKGPEDNITSNLVRGSARGTKML